MVNWMPWIITAVVVFGSLSVLAVAIVVLSRVIRDQGAQMSALSTRKPFYVLDVEGGKPGVRKVVRMEPSVEPPDEGPVSLDEPPAQVPGC